ncbi:hypothetical protein F5X99DRAFT_369093 [Biscogniauxia marginata]|nr:hypothetical protein F5X99DRAFT_369093 [Biscogniauxia marginata]
MKSTSSLLSMPLEVLLQITSYLTTEDYGRLRTSCKHIEASLFKSFAKEFFSKRQFSITEFSLNALIAISKSRFASSVTYLIIHLERPVRNALGNPIFPSPTLTIDRALSQNIFREHYFRHLELTNTGQDVELLTEALKNLPKLETVGLRDFNSGGRYREDTSWHSYGTPTFLADTSAILERPNLTTTSGLERDDSKYICHVFLAILRALGNARDAQPAPSRLEVILRHCYLPDRAFSIPRHLEPKIFPVLADLKALFVVVNSTYPDIMVAYTETSAKSYPMFLLSKFLLRTPSLKHLRLNFDGYNNHAVDSLLRWLSEKPYSSRASTTGASASILAIDSHIDPSKLPTVPPPLELCSLEHLEIGTANIEPEVLLNLYRKYKSTLRSISLHKVSLIDLVHEYQDKINLWAKLCNQMAKLGLGLTNIKFSYVSQQHNGSSHKCPVGFDPTGVANPYVKEWTGSDLSHALKDFVDSLTVHWPEDPATDDDDEDEDEDEDINEDDDDDDEENDLMGEDEDEDEDPMATAPMTLDEVVAIALGTDQNLDLGG